MSKWKKNNFTLAATVEVDVVATLGKRIKITTLPINEAKALAKKQSNWRIQLFQQGFHAYKATE